MLPSELQAAPSIRARSRYSPCKLQDARCNPSSKPTPNHLVSKPLCSLELGSPFVHPSSKLLLSIRHTSRFHVSEPRRFHPYELRTDTFHRSSKLFSSARAPNRSYPYKLRVDTIHTSSKLLFSTWTPSCSLQSGLQAALIHSMLRATPVYTSFELLRTIRAPSRLCPYDLQVYTLHPSCKIIFSVGAPCCFLYSELQAVRFFLSYEPFPSTGAPSRIRPSEL